MSEQPGFILHHSDQLPFLAKALGDCLSQASPSEILQPDTILIPQPSMRRWLQNSLAEQFGIAANLDFCPPGSYVNAILEAWLPKSLPLLAPEQLHWRLFGLLQDPRVLKQPDFQLISEYFQTGEPQLRAWQLAGELGEAFEKYQAWRKNWLLNWHRKAPEHDWQGKLWHLASQGHAFRAQAYQNYFNTAQKQQNAKPLQLPSRLFVFACQNISPDMLQLLRSFGQWSQVHFFLHNPCHAYWGDVQQPITGQALLDLHFDNALLNQCGRAGRDFVASLLSEQSAFDIDDRPNYSEGNASALPLLKQIQHDILHRQAAEIKFPVYSHKVQDSSLQIHSCHTPLREVQVLRAQLLDLFEQNPELEPRDIAVMAPDLDLYAPYFTPVFMQNDGLYASLPFALSDQALFAESNIAKLFFRLLSLKNSRFSGNDGFELLSQKYVAEYYGLQTADLERIHFWLDQAAVRWGIDSQHRESVDGVAQLPFTWRYGLQRLLFGYASADPALVDGIAPVLAPTGQDQRLLDALFAFTDFIEQVHAGLNQNMAAEQWQELLQSLLHKFTDQPSLEDDELESFNQLNAKINALAEFAAQSGTAQLLSASVVIDYLQDEGEQRLSQAWLSGRITICKMVPMRLIPFKVICLLGMNENAFPRQEPSAAINRLAGDNANRLIGDRNTREDDRFLFLQLLSSCQEHFYISYIGQNLKDNTGHSPSILVNELLDTVCRYFPNPSECKQQFIMQHCLQAYEHGNQADPRIVALQKPEAFETHTEIPLFAPIYAGDAWQPQDSVQLSIQQLTAFWLKPIETLAKSLGIRLAEQEILLEEDEPYGTLSGLDAYQLEHQIIENSLQPNPEPAAELLSNFQASGLLAPGALGQTTFSIHAARVDNAMADLRDLRIPDKSWPIELALDRAAISGELIQHYSNGLIQVRVNKPLDAKQHIRSGLKALLVAASGLHLQCFDLDKDVLKQRMMNFDPEQARGRLQQLTDLYQIGNTHILCFEPKTSYDFYCARLEDTELDVNDWLEESLNEEDEAFLPAFDDNLDFLTYGQGFISGVAMKNPQQFEHLALLVFDALMGGSNDD